MLTILSVISVRVWYFCKQQLLNCQATVFFNKPLNEYDVCLVVVVFLLYFILHIVTSKEAEEAHIFVAIFSQGAENYMLNWILAFFM